MASMKQSHSEARNSRTQEKSEAVGRQWAKMAIHWQAAVRAALALGAVYTGTTQTLCGKCLIASQIATWKIGQTIEDGRRNRRRVK